MKKTIFFILSIGTLLHLSCSSKYSYLDASDFKKGDWYIFKDFKYKGSLSEGLPNGLGTVVYNNGVEVYGYFTKGILSSKNATYTIPRVGTIKGNVYDGYLSSGEILYNNGDYYKGAIGSYSPNGKGVAVQKNGDIIYGNFRNGTVSGEGYHYIASQNIQRFGQFVNGKLDGDVVEKNTLTGEGTVKIFNNGTDQTSNMIVSRAREAVETQEERALSNLEQNYARSQDQLKKSTAEKKAKYESNKAKSKKWLEYESLSAIKKKEEKYRMIQEILDEECTICNCGIIVEFQDPDAPPRGISWWNGCIMYERKGWTLKQEEEWEKDQEEVCDRLRRECSQNARLMAQDFERYKNEALSNIRRMKEDYERANRAYYAAPQDLEREKANLMAKQARERTRKIEEAKAREKEKLKQKAQQRIRERQAQCRKYPNNCGCTPPKEMSKCAQDPKVACVCQV